MYHVAILKSFYLLKDLSVDVIYWTHAFNMVALHMFECMSAIILAILSLSSYFYFYEEYWLFCK